MPELPEVETVRSGLEKHVVGRTITDVEVLHPRAVRRHVGDAPDLVGRLSGATILAARRRGKYLWLDVAAPQGDDRFALVVHLGMSGQMLVARVGAPDHTHLRVRATLDDGNELRFVDQRTFGGWHLDDYVDAGEELPGDSGALPRSIAHIAPDPFDPAFDRDDVVRRMRGKHTEVKRALLDQSLVSGVGNIYADEALESPAQRNPCDRRYLEGETRRTARRGDRGDERCVGRRRHVVRRAVRQRQRAVRVLRTVVERLWEGGPTVPTLRDADATGGVHEPLELLLPGLSAQTLAVRSHAPRRCSLVTTTSVGGSKELSGRYDVVTWKYRTLWHRLSYHQTRRQGERRPRQLSGASSITSVKGVIAR